MEGAETPDEPNESPDEPEHLSDEVAESEPTEPVAESDVEPAAPLEEEAEAEPEPQPERTGRLAWAYRLRPWLRGLIAFLVYLTTSIVIWGLPILAHLTTRYEGKGASDSKLYQWGLVWWPYALRHGLDPFFSHMIWAPGGVNLTWVTTQPGPSIVMAPITETFGPLASYNVLMLLAPALAAFCTYLCCARITRRFWPSLLGGAVFGFSSYMSGQMAGHVNLVLIFPVPLGLYLVLRRTDRTIGRVRFAALFALTLMFLFATSTEVFGATVLFAVPAWLGALAFAKKGSRGKVLEIGALMGLAGALAALALTPYLLALFRNVPAQQIRPTDLASVDVLGFVIPRDRMLLGGQAWSPVTDTFTLAAIEDGSYLGVGLLGIVLAFVVSGWRRRETWLVLGFILLTAAAAMGPRLHVGGRNLGPWPGSVVQKIPLLDQATPQRFSMFIWIGVAVAVAVWLAKPARTVLTGTKWVAALVAVALLAPAVSSPPYHSTQRIPAFYAEGTWRSQIGPGDIVYIMPKGFAFEMLYQASTGMGFPIASGYIGPVPEAYLVDIARKNISYNHVRIQLDPGQFQDFFGRHDVTVVLADDPMPPLFRSVLDQATGVEPALVGDVWVYRLSGSPPQPAASASAP